MHHPPRPEEAFKLPDLPLQSPKYEKTSALTPDGGLINGVRVLSQGKHLEAGQMKHLRGPKNAIALSRK